MICYPPAPGQKKGADQAMIVRIWRTQIDETRAADYRDLSLPMFRAQRGFDGVFFAARRAERAVISFWRDLSSVEALDVSSTYQATVAEIEATGMLRGESAVEVLEIEEGFFDVAFVGEAGTRDR
jgi:hypothetical protein